MHSKFLLQVGVNIPICKYQFPGLYNICKIEIENLDNNLMKFSVCINQTTGKERKNNKKHE